MRLSASKPTRSSPTSSKSSDFLPHAIVVSIAYLYDTCRDCTVDEEDSSSLLCVMFFVADDIALCKQHFSESPLFFIDEDTTREGFVAQIEH